MEALHSFASAWYHHSKEKGKYQIVFRRDKYIETNEHGLVIIGVSELDAGRYDFWLNGALLCSYNITEKIFK
ncbi:hypothetical protein Phum_PHUM406270 [Pediculus humanus corporis]|uniref:Uncharacterized protein n=1 Tax=Pediculus humanus subsp. corporis TaxID=121224 RepID=E0VRX3_PEDHC|nr:uncharacterized protein Phum_PHUM406270 [Pediculus humanus corporis]EEB16129.1 hypothetical protein Phum_PHUM406270 [Pediculus humanus corporis]